MAKLQHPQAQEGQGSKSATSGKAGGLQKVEPLKAVEAVNPTFKGLWQGIENFPVTTAVSKA